MSITVGIAIIYKTLWRSKVLIHKQNSEIVHCDKRIWTLLRSSIVRTRCEHGFNRNVRTACTAERNARLNSQRVFPPRAPPRFPIRRASSSWTSSLRTSFCADHAWLPTPIHSGHIDSVWGERFLFWKAGVKYKTPTPTHCGHIGSVWGECFLFAKIAYEISVLSATPNWVEGGLGGEKVALQTFWQIRPK